MLESRLFISWMRSTMSPTLPSPVTAAASEAMSHRVSPGATVTTSTCSTPASWVATEPAASHTPSANASSTPKAKTTRRPRRVRRTVRGW